MSEEEKIFVRTSVGKSATSLHSHGGPEAHEEDKTEREDLEGAIEQLNDAEESENLVSIAEQMGDFKDELIEESDIEAIESEAPAEESAPEKTEPIVEKPVEEKPIEEPRNDWKAKDENKAYVPEPTSVEPAPTPKPEKKKKSGRGWCAATVFLLFVIFALVGSAAYIVMTNNKFDIFGRTIETYKTGTKTTTPEPTTPAQPVEPEKKEDVSYENGKLVIDKWGVSLNMQGAKFVDFEYNETTDSIMLWLVAPTDTAGLTETPAVADSSVNTASMGIISYNKTQIDTEATGSTSELIYTIPGNGGYIYYNHVQSLFSDTLTADKEAQALIETNAIKFLEDTVLKGNSFSLIK